MEHEKFDYTKSQLEDWDFVVLFLYFAGILTVGIWSSRPSGKKWCASGDDDAAERQQQTHDDKVGGYFLASRNMHWIPVGASLFASNIGSEHFIGLAGSAAATGVAIATYELNAIFILMLLGWLFVPVYHASGVYTMPEYMRKRFGRQRIRIALSILSLLIYVLTKISADLYAGALFIKYAMGFAGTEGLYLSILVLLGIAAFFCIAGGLSAVIWTDFVQTILMVIGALTIMGLALVEVGGYENLMDGYSVAVADEEYTAHEYDPETGVNKSCGAVREDFAHLFHSVDDTFLPWSGVIPGMLLVSIYYWCTDQVIVQRLLAAKNISHAKGGTVLAGFLKLLPLFTLVLPGMAARIMFPNEVACSSPEKCQEVCGSESGCSNVAFVFLVLKLAPTVLRGLMLAVMLAALMSSLTSIFNSSSTIFTMDVWKLVRKNPSPIEMVFVGRSFVVVLLAIAIAWIPVITRYSNAQLFVYVQVISNFFQPPIAAIFVLAMLWHRTTEPGAFWGLMTGFVIGLVRFGLEFGYSVPPCGSGLPDPRPEWVKTWVGGFHYLHFGAALFGFTALVAAIISLLTEPIPEEKLRRMTFWSRFSGLPRVDHDDSDEIRAHSEYNRSKLFSTENIGWPKKILFRLCGVNKEDLEQETHRVEAREMSPEEEAKEIASFLKEDNFWRRVLNCSAVCALCSATFVFAFYA